MSDEMETRLGCLVAVVLLPLWWPVFLVLVAANFEHVRASHGWRVLWELPWEIVKSVWTGR